MNETQGKYENRGYMDIKTLRYKLRQEKIKLQSLNMESQGLNRKRSLKENEVKEIEKEIENLKNGIVEIPITEHALIRYFERVIDFDLEEIKEKILNDKIKKEYIQNGDGKYYNDEMNCLVVIKEDKIVTLYYGNE
jgi:hypothetical protein